MYILRSENCIKIFFNFFYTSNVLSLSMTSPCYVQTAEKKQKQSSTT
jgi:hypothetical protein